MADKAVLFDIGATLINGPSSSPTKQICQMLDLSNSQRNLIAELIMCHDFKDSSELAQKLSSIFPLPLGFGKDLATLWLEQFDSAKEVKGASFLIDKLKKNGFKIGLVSDIWHPYHQAFLKACPEIVPNVDVQILSFREGIRKPSLKLYKKALEKLEVSPQNTWMVGDTYLNDLKPCLSLGIKTAWVLARPKKEYVAMSKILLGEWQMPEAVVSELWDLKDFAWE